MRLTTLVVSILVTLGFLSPVGASEIKMPTPTPSSAPPSACSMNDPEELLALFTDDPQLVKGSGWAQVEFMSQVFVKGYRHAIVRLWNKFAVSNPILVQCDSPEGKWVYLARFDAGLARLGVLAGEPEDVVLIMGNFEIHFDGLVHANKVSGGLLLDAAAPKIRTGLLPETKKSLLGAVRFQDTIYAIVEGYNNGNPLVEVERIQEGRWETVGWVRESLAQVREVAGPFVHTPHNNPQLSVDHERLLLHGGFLAGVSFRKFNHRFRSTVDVKSGCAAWDGQIWRSCD
jgi:hypothetical protein